MSHNIILKCSSFVVVMGILLMFGGDGGVRSEEIRISMCQHMPYDRTKMPNFLHHSTQQNANLSIEQFRELVNSNCNPDLNFFLCAMYAPMYAPEFIPDAVPPCRELCERVRDSCEPLMLLYDVSWPEFLDCSKLPHYDRAICVSPEAIVDTHRQDGEDAVLPNSTYYGFSGGNESESLDTPYPLPPRPPERVELGEVCGHCPDKVARRASTFVDKDYDFALKGNVTALYVRAGIESITVVDVQSVRKSGIVVIPLGDTPLWTPGPCVCPRIELGVEYMIIGYEDRLRDRLLLTHDSMIDPWIEDWDRKFDVFETKLRRLEMRRRRRRRRQHQRRGQYTTRYWGADGYPPVVLAPENATLLELLEHRERINPVVQYLRGSPRPTGGSTPSPTQPGDDIEVRDSHNNESLTTEGPV